MEIKFKIDSSRMTLGNLIAIEEAADATWRDRRDLLANHMLNNKGEFYTPKDAKTFLNALTMDELEGAFKSFAEAIKELADNQLPPPNAAK